MTKLPPIKHEKSPEEIKRRRYESHRKWWKSHVVERRAHAALARALQLGEIKRPENCQRCGASGRIEGHHEDHYKPLEVEWLCKPCHGKTRRGIKWWKANPLIETHVPAIEDHPPESDFAIHLKTINRIKEIAARVEGRESTA